MNQRPARTFFVLAMVKFSIALANSSVAQAETVKFQPKLCGVNKIDRQAVYVDRVYMGQFADSEEKFAGFTLVLSNGKKEEFAVQGKSAPTPVAFQYHVQSLSSRESAEKLTFEVALDEQGRPLALSGESIDGALFKAEVEIAADPNSPCADRDGTIRPFPTRSQR